MNNHREVLYNHLLAGRDSFTFVDVGARGFGYHYFGGAQHFLDLLAFEPDREEYNALLKSELKEAWRSVQVSPWGISGTNGRRELYLTPSRGCSSLCKPKDEYAKRYDRDEFFTVEKTVDIETVTLSRAFQQHRIENAVFMKIDIEGAELEVLQAADLSFENICAIESEGNFLPYRENQCDAGALIKFLQDQNFDLVQIRDIGEYRYCGIGTSYPQSNSTHDNLPVYSRGDICSADFIFLKKPEFVAERFLRAYAAICIELEQFDKAMIALQKLNEPALVNLLRDHSSNVYRKRKRNEFLIEKTNLFVPLRGIKLGLMSAIRSARRIGRRPFLKGSQA